MLEERLTRQDLIYAATALRQSARLAEKQSKDPGLTSMRLTFARLAETRDALAAKFDRIAGQMK